MHKSFRRLSAVGLAAALCLQFLMTIGNTAYAEVAERPQKLEIVQLKVDSDNQFVTIHNPSTSAADLNDYELNYLNADKKPTKTFVLNGTLDPGGYFVLSDGQISICHLMTLESVSLNFSTSGGTLQLWRYQDEFTKTLDSHVSWVKSAKPDTPVDTLVLPTENDEFLNKTNDDWLVVRPSLDNSCQLETTQAAQKTKQPKAVFDLLPGNLPPVRFVPAPNPNKSAALNRNKGKMAPVINELLPNPASPLKDANDEFIELYNPNSSKFDLKDFQLAFGSDNPRKYTFPEGVILGPGEFKAITSGDTSISLANSIAQVWLLDPLGEVVSQSEAYEDAKDGQAWALNNGTWQWTSAPSPNESNTLTSQSSGSDDNATAKVLGISSNGSGGSSTPGATLASATTEPSQLEDAVPLHPVVLAVVGLLAVGYAVYEYRHDIGNSIFKIRRYFQLRRETR